MCRCSCVQISISQRGRTEETAHAFQSTEHLVHLFLSLHLIFWKVWTLGNWIFFFPLPELLPSQPSTLSSFSLLFISNPRYLQKTYLLAAKRQKIETWALCTVLHLHRGGLIECVETFWILKKSVKMLKRRARQSHAWICLWQTRGSKRKPLTNLNSFIFNTLRYLKTDFSNSQRSKAPFWMHHE